MKAYSIMLCLFIFGFITAGVNELQIFDVQMPEQQTSIDEATVTELSEGVEAQGINPLMMYSVVMTVFHVISGGFLALLSIMPLMVQYGIPIPIAMMIQGPVWLIEVWGIYQFITGYATQGMD